MKSTYYLLFFFVFSINLLISAKIWGQSDSIEKRKYIQDPENYYNVNLINFQQKNCNNTVKIIKNNSDNFLLSTNNINSADILIWPTGWEQPTHSQSQSENSIFISPSNPNIIFSANNNFYKLNEDITSKFVKTTISTDGGQTWTEGGPLEYTRADPAAVIDLQGRMYVGYINRRSTGGGGQSISWSDDNGLNWNHVPIADGMCTNGNPWDDCFVGVQDKNHLWVDNNPKSPFKGNLYSAWSNYGSSPVEIRIRASQMPGRGELGSWVPVQVISNDVNAVYTNQGANIQTGPNGEVYVVWSIYDLTATMDLSPENAIGFSRSLNGGQNWNVDPSIPSLKSKRIIDDIRGIRGMANYPSSYGYYQYTNMLHFGWPSMTVNQITGEIYVAWANIGEPCGNATPVPPNCNTGYFDIYMIKSTDKGDNWSSPIKISQGVVGEDHWNPWITCDEVTGAIVAIYYDNLASDIVNTSVAISYDGGMNWSEFQVNDDITVWQGEGPYSSKYAGDYICVDVYNGKVIPVWTDNRIQDNGLGILMPYTSPFKLPCDLEDLTFCNNNFSGTFRTYLAKNTITTAGTGCNYSIVSGKTVEMFAGTSISLKPGFSAQAGSHYHAAIQDVCDYYTDFWAKKNNNRLVAHNNLKSQAKNVKFKNSLTNYPNPFKEQITLEYNTKLEESVKLTVYNIYGQVVSELVNKDFHPAGKFKVDYNSSSLPEGLYYFVLQTGEEIITQKAIKTNN